MLKRTQLLSLLLLSLLTACDKKEPAAPSPQSAAPSAPASEYAPPSAAPESGAIAVAQANDTGKKVYDKTCVACHAVGVAGAPKLGDKALWGPRIAQGMDTLYNHSIKGFQGKTGVMPPKGGNVSLTDAELKAAVDYMVAQSR